MPNEHKHLGPAKGSTMKITQPKPPEGATMNNKHTYDPVVWSCKQKNYTLSEIEEARRKHSALFDTESHLNTNIGAFYEFAPDLYETMRKANQELLDRLQAEGKLLGLTGWEAGE